MIAIKLPIQFTKKGTRLIIEIGKMGYKRSELVGIYNIIRGDGSKNIFYVDNEATHITMEIGNNSYRESIKEVEVEDSYK